MTTQTRRLCPLIRIAALALTIGSPFTVLAEDTHSLRRTATVRAIQRAEPAVVNIEGNKPASSVTGAAADQQQVNGMGAGVIVDSRGYILTNQHVIQDVRRIEVTLHNGRQYIGKLIARHAETDLAMIKIDAGRPLPTIQCGTSSDLMRGEPVIAIGNPFGYHDTVTVGIISALHRDIPVNGVQDYPDLIQTDASINPGNSGGPLLNADGLMIGINAAVRIGAQGIGFAIPVDRAVEVGADMIARYRGSVGSYDVEVATRFKDNKSYLQVISSKDPALLPGDVLTSVAGRPVENRMHYELALIGRRGGSKVEYEYIRGDEQLATNVMLHDASSSRVQLVSTSGSVKEQMYYRFGMRLEPANATQVRRIDANYEGGLRVQQVRKNSPASRASIQPGDILVGMLEWQTPDWGDLEWIMERPEMRNSNAPKFHIIRGSRVFFGNFEMR